MALLGDHLRGKFPGPIIAYQRVGETKTSARNSKELKVQAALLQRGRHSANKTVACRNALGKVHLVSIKDP